MTFCGLNVRAFSEEAGRAHSPLYAHIAEGLSAGALVVFLGLPWYKRAPHVTPMQLFTASKICRLQVGFTPG